jgi:hypothetical protein
MWRFINDNPNKATLWCCSPPKKENENENEIDINIILYYIILYYMWKLNRRERIKGKGQLLRITLRIERKVSFSLIASSKIMVYNLISKNM